MDDTTISRINEVLTLIDYWMATLENSQLSEQCRIAGRDFFSFMQSRGVYAGWCVYLIRTATGYHPQQLWMIEDAEMLRSAIINYESIQGVVPLIERDHGITDNRKRRQNAQAIAAWFFGNGGSRNG